MESRLYPTKPPGSKLEIVQQDQTIVPAIMLRKKQRKPLRGKDLLQRHKLLLESQKGRPFASSCNYQLLQRNAALQQKLSSELDKLNSQKKRRLFQRDWDQQRYLTHQLMERDGNTAMFYRSVMGQKDPEFTPDKALVPAVFVDTNGLSENNGNSFSQSSNSSPFHHASEKLNGDSRTLPFMYGRSVASSRASGCSQEWSQSNSEPTPTPAKQLAKRESIHGRMLLYEGVTAIRRTPSFSRSVTLNTQECLSCFGRSVSSMSSVTDTKTDGGSLAKNVTRGASRNDRLNVLPTNHTHRNLGTREVSIARDLPSAKLAEVQLGKLVSGLPSQLAGQIYHDTNQLCSVSRSKMKTENQDVVRNCFQDKRWKNIETIPFSLVRPNSREPNYLSTFYQ